MAVQTQPTKMGNNQIQQLKAGVDDSDAVNKGQMDAAIQVVTDALSGLDYAAKTQTDFISGLIAVPTNSDYRIVVKLPYALTITSTTTICVSGTCTATFKINTTALGGTANSVSSSEQEQAHSSSNAASVGDDLVITLSANSSCQNLSFTIKFTRELD